MTRRRCTHQPGTTSFTSTKRDLESGFGSEKLKVIPRSLIAVTPAKRTRPMNAMRVFAGDT